MSRDLSSGCACSLDCGLSLPRFPPTNHLTLARTDTRPGRLADGEAIHDCVFLDVMNTIQPLDQNSNSDSPHGHRLRFGRADDFPSFDRVTGVTSLNTMPVRQRDKRASSPQSLLTVPARRSEKPSFAICSCAGPRGVSSDRRLSDRSCACDIYLPASLFTSI